MSRSYSSFSELPTTTQHALLLHCAALRLHPFIQVLPVCPSALLSTSPRLERFSPSPPRHLRPAQTLPSSFALRYPGPVPRHFPPTRLIRVSRHQENSRRFRGNNFSTAALSPSKQHSLGSPNASFAGSNISLNKEESGVSSVITRVIKAPSSLSCSIPFPPDPTLRSLWVCFLLPFLSDSQVPNPSENMDPMRRPISRLT